MSYESYHTHIQNERLKEKEKLLESNVRRAEASLPLYDVDSELDRLCPVMTREQWDEQEAFLAFYEAEQAKHPTQAEVFEANGGDAKATAQTMHIRHLKIHEAWKSRDK